MSESLTNKLPGAGVQTSYVHSSIILLIAITIRIIRIIISIIAIIKIIAIIIIIIIFAEWQLFNEAGYLIEERRRWPIITASPPGHCSK